MSLRTAALPLLTGLLSACAVSPIATDPAIECSSCIAWNDPQEPFQVYGNTYYVGVAGLAVILIDTGDGLILLDGALPQSVPSIIDNIEALGFSLADVRIIAVSHAHYDHVGGVAALQRVSAARVIASAANAVAMRRGSLIADDPQHGGRVAAFPAIVDVDVVDNNEIIELGNTHLSAIATPGHAPGGTSWSWTSCAEDVCRSVVYADSLSAVAAQEFRYSDADNGAAEHIRNSAEKIAQLDCDVFLAPHPFYFEMTEKLQRPAGENPFVDNACADYASRAVASLKTRLQQEMGL